MSPFPSMKAFCLAFVLLPLLACAEDFTLADDTKFKGTVTRVDPDGLIVETERGVEKLAYYALTAADQKRFGLSTKTAEEFRLQQKATRTGQLAEQVASVQAQAAALEKKLQEAPTPAQMEVRLRVGQSGFTAEAVIRAGAEDGVRGPIATHRGKAAATALDKSTRVGVSARVLSMGCREPMAKHGAARCIPPVTMAM